MTENSKDKVIVRFPPSPTGRLHIGNIRSLLFNYLYAKKCGGDIVMRFEDTDEARSKKEYEDFALKTLSDLGLDFDRGPFRQSERKEFYRDAIETLIRNDKAFEAEEKEGGDGEKVIRFRNPNKIVTFVDTVKGEIKIDTTSFGDFVIARSKKSPLYHLTVVVDDIDMGVTDVIRGEDHVTSTPRQILLIEALGGNIPRYTHLPLIIGDDKKKLGKRHGAVTWNEFKGLGYLPEAIINYLALLGWNPGNGDEREIFSKEELINEFSLEKVNNSPATFSYIKLDDINRQWMLKLDKEKYYKKALEFISPKIRGRFEESKEKGQKIIEKVVRERISKFSEIIDMENENEFDYYFSNPVVADSDLVFKTDGLDKTLEILTKTSDILEKIPVNEWNFENLKNSLWDWSGEIGRGSVLHPLRTILTGAKRSPDPFTVMEILGKEESLGRINRRIS
ncbi:MAG: glutamate--tRNA ligase [Candidatus Pacebacteria bacterium]|nr:glutamate--tRNA ligase [Candidatus Paceibacterota bacterium]